MADQRVDPFADNPAMAYLTGMQQGTAAVVEQPAPEPPIEEPPAAEHEVRSRPDVAARPPATPTTRSRGNGGQKAKEKAPQPPPVNEPAVRAQPVPVPKSRRGGSARLCLYLPEDLMELVEDIVYFTPGLNKTRFVKDALERHAADKVIENGGPFPQRPIEED